MPKLIERNGRSSKLYLHFSMKQSKYKGIQSQKILSHLIGLESAITAHRTVVVVNPSNHT